jgi:hypothetical protein
MDREHITRRLGEIAAAHGVELLFAAESGSRAWGFASTDSDYDIRFIYRHPTPWYLALDDRRDVIELPLDADGLDVSGWDVRKALRLLLRSNPPLHEWLVSPIVYLDRDGFGAALRALFERHAVPRAWRSITFPWRAASATCWDRARWCGASATCTSPGRWWPGCCCVSGAGRRRWRCQSCWPARHFRIPCCGRSNR